MITKNENVDILLELTSEEEQFKTIRTNIKFLMQKQKMKTISITSAGRGEGKSLVAANLAISFSRQGKKVLLVDSNFRNPFLHKMFNLKNKTGFSNLLAGENIDLDKVYQNTKYDELSVLTSGTSKTDPTSLLDSLEINELIAKFEDNFDLVIFDLPMVLDIVDARIVCAKSDGTVFVVRKNVSNKNDVLISKQELDMSNANVLGVVFNGVACD